MRDIDLRERLLHVRLIGDARVEQWIELAFCFIELLQCDELLREQQPRCSGGRTDRERLAQKWDRLGWRRVHGCSVKLIKDLRLQLPVARDYARRHIGRLRSAPVGAPSPPAQDSRAHSWHRARGCRRGAFERFRNRQREWIARPRRSGDRSLRPALPSTRCADR